MLAFEVKVYSNGGSLNREVLVISDYVLKDRGVFLREVSSGEVLYREWLSTELPEEVLLSRVDELLAKDIVPPEISTEVVGHG